MKKTTDSVSLPTHTRRIWGDFRRCFRLGRMPRRGIFARVENQAGERDGAVCGPRLISQRTAMPTA